MHWVYPAGVFLSGLIVGSFLNVCIYRLPRSGKSPLRGFSQCPKCNKFIKWYDNIPVVSYLVLRGRCRGCQVHIPIRYPVIETLTACAFVGVFFQSGMGSWESIIKMVVNAGLMSALIISTFVDLDFRIIPDEITISGMVFAPIVSFLFPFLHEPLEFLRIGNISVDSLIASLVGMVMGGGVVYLIGFFGKLVFRKEAMGLGDVKLMCFLGGFLGYESIIFVFLLACVIGSLIGIVSLLITKDHYIAFGPYLALGACIMIFLKKDITHFVYVVYPGLLQRIFGL